MQAMIAKLGIPESESAREEIALWAFRMGQAMAATNVRLHASEVYCLEIRGPLSRELDHPILEARVFGFGAHERPCDRAADSWIALGLERIETGAQLR